MKSVPLSCVNVVTIRDKLTVARSPIPLGATSSGALHLTFRGLTHQEREPSGISQHILSNEWVTFRHVGMTAVQSS